MMLASFTLLLSPHPMTLSANCSPSVALPARAAAVAGLAGLLGGHMTASIGGADKPVVITLLNSYRWMAGRLGGMMRAAAVGRHTRNLPCANFAEAHIGPACCPCYST